MLPKFNSLLELVQRFPDEKSCHQYLAGQRWDGQLECPYSNCMGQDSYVFKDGIRYKCKWCNRVYTAKTNSIFESSKLPLIKWLMAMYMIMHKKGISSVQLGKDLGVTQKTAWFLLQRIRWVLGNEEPVQLEGTVQLDETFVGGKNKNRHADKKVKNSQGRSFKDKTPVMGMLQENEYQVCPDTGKNIIAKHSRVICMVVDDTKANSIQPIIRDYVKDGSIVVSDEWHAYTGLNDTYHHYVVDHGKKQYVHEEGFTSNALEGFWSHVKRSIIGIYHKTTRKHLQKYFYEFTFRHNYRNLAIQKQMDIILNNVNCRLKYKDLIA